MNLTKTNQKGFTIVELLIVIVVIAILAAISIVAFTGVQERARNSSAFSLASQVSKKADVYYALNGSYPTSAANFTGEAALEGAKVSFGTGTTGYPTTASFSNTPAGANATALSQFGSGNRVMYSGTANGYSIFYRTGTSSRDVISKGTPPTGSWTAGTNENL